VLAAGQPDGQPPGGEVIEGAARTATGSDIIDDDTLLHWQIWEQSIPRPHLFSARTPISWKSPRGCTTSAKA
jgi:hypothetical protein